MEMVLPESGCSVGFVLEDPGHGGRGRLGFCSMPSHRSLPQCLAGILPLSSWSWSLEKPVGVASSLPGDHLAAEGELEKLENWSKRPVAKTTGRCFFGCTAHIVYRSLP